jgi:hypothetical protein
MNATPPARIFALSAAGLEMGRAEITLAGPEFQPGLSVPLL